MFSTFSENMAFCDIFCENMTFIFYENLTFFKIFKTWDGHTHRRHPMFNSSKIYRMRLMTNDQCFSSLCSSSFQLSLLLSFGLSFWSPHIFFANTNLGGTWNYFQFFMFPQILFQLIRNRE